MEKLLHIVDESIKQHKVHQIILSKVKKKDDKAFHKVVIKPVSIKGRVVYQFGYQYPKKISHVNMEKHKAVEACMELIQDYFQQVNIFTTEADYQAMISKKGKVHLQKKDAYKERH